MFLKCFDLTSIFKSEDTGVSSSRAATLNNLASNAFMMITGQSTYVNPSDRPTPQEIDHIMDLLCVMVKPVTDGLGKPGDGTA